MFHPVWLYTVWDLFIAKCRMVNIWIKLSNSQSDASIRIVRNQKCNTNQETKTNVIYTEKRKPLNKRFLMCVRYIQNMAGLKNICKRQTFSLTWDSDVTVRHKFTLCYQYIIHIWSFVFCAWPLLHNLKARQLLYNLKICPTIDCRYQS